MKIENEGKKLTWNKQLKWFLWLPPSCCWQGAGFHSAFFGLVRIRRRYIHKTFLFLDTNWKPVGRLRVIFLLRIVLFLGEPSGRSEIYILTRIGERVQRSLGADDAKLSKLEFSVLHFCFLLISSTSHSGRLDGIVDEITGHSYRSASCVLNSHCANYILSPIEHFSLFSRAA